MLKVYVIFLALLFSASQSCSKKELGKTQSFFVFLNDTVPCYDPLIDTTTLPPGWVHTIPSSFHVDAPFNASFPVFNPSNPNKLAFVKNVKDSLRLSQLIILDLVTGTTQNIYTCPTTIFAMRWNNDGSIVFSRSDNHQVYSISDNGSGLKQITSNKYYNNNPIWYNNNTEIIVAEEFKRLLRYSSEGQFIDTISLHGICCYQSQDCIDNGDIFIAHIPYHNDQFAILHKDGSINYHNFALPLEPNAQYDGFIIYGQYNPSNVNEIFFVTNYGLYKIDLQTNITTAIKASCRSKLIGPFTISTDGQTIIASVNIRQRYANGNVGAHDMLYKYKIDGSEEKIVNIR